MARFGINTERAFGVSMKALEPLARKYRRNHQLAVDLWASGYHEARLLAALIDDPTEVTPEQMDAWAADFDSWCLKLFVRTRFRALADLAKRSMSPRSVLPSETDRAAQALTLAFSLSSTM